MEQTAKKGFHIPGSFILRFLIWLGLNASFVLATGYYEQFPFFLHLAFALNTFLTASVLISIGKFIMVYLYNRKHANSKVRGNFVLGISRLAAVLNGVFVIISLMIALGINLKEFVTSMTIVAMAIAVIFREYITNMISGLLIMFSDQFSIGDHVRIGDHSGKIIDITFANIVMLNEEDDIVLTPNNLAFTATMINKSSLASNRITVKFDWPLGEAFDIAVLQEKLLPVLKPSTDISWVEEPTIKIAEIGKDFVSYKLDLLAIDSSNRRHKRIESLVLNAILAFK